jgi:hypothetical protein
MRLAEVRWRSRAATLMERFFGLSRQSGSRHGRRQSSTIVSAFDRADEQDHVRCLWPGRCDVIGERRAQIVERLVGDASELAAKRLCEVCAEVTGVSVAGIMLMSGDVRFGSLCDSSAVSAVADQLQFTLGEGPGMDAYQHEWPVLEPDLAAPSTPRWPAFAGPAIEAGVRAAFSFPVRVGAIRLGALNLYSDRPGELSAEQRAVATIMADVAAQAILLMEANAPTAKLACELEGVVDFEHVVNQASGMIAAQLDISVGQALIRLRMYAFGNDRPVADVARDVVTRMLRVESHGDDDGTELEWSAPRRIEAGIRRVAESRDSSREGEQGIR